MTVTITNFEKDGKEFIRVNSPYNPSFIKRAKEIRGKYNGADSIKAWEFPVESKSKLDSLLSTIYGTTDGSVSEKVAVRLTFLETVIAEQDSIIIAGRIIAIGRGRDTGAKCGRDITFDEGNMGTDGSRKNWHTFIEEGSVFEVFEFEKAALKQLDKIKSVKYEIIE